MATFVGEREQLFDACQTGTWQKVSRLLKAGAQLHWTDPDGYSPLHYACFGNNMGVAEKLLEEASDRDRQDINSQSRDRLETPLHIACRQGYLSMVGFLLERGAQVMALDTSKNAPLHMASIYGHEPVVQRLITHQDVDINAKNVFGYTPLFQACFHNCPSVVKTLVERGADVNEKSCRGVSPLHEAIRSGNMNVLTLILQKDPDVNATDSEGQTPLHDACEFYCEQAVRILIDRGAEVNMKNVHNETPLHIATGSGYVDIARLLQKAEATIGTAAVEDSNV